MDAFEEKNEECLCQKPHGYKKTVVSLFAPQLTAFMPAGVKAVFLGGDALRARLSKIYRLYCVDDILQIGDRGDGDRGYCGGGDGDRGGDSGGDRGGGDCGDRGGGDCGDRGGDSGGGDRGGGDRGDGDCGGAYKSDSQLLNIAAKNKRASGALNIQSKKNKIDLFSRDFAAEFKKLNLPEDIRLVITEGGFNAFGKYITQRLSKQSAGIKHLVCGGGNLSRFDFVRGCFDGKSNNDETNKANGKNSENSGKEGGGTYFLKKFNGAQAVLTDFEGVDAPSGFAFVINTYLSLFDWDIASLLFGKEGVCGYIFSEAKKNAQKLLEAVKTLPKRSAALKRQVFCACLKTAELIETAGGTLCTSGSVQAAAALSMLFKREGRPTTDLFDAAFLLSPAVARLYAAFLEEQPFSFPPDNSLHSAKLSEYLGLNDFESAALPPPYFNKRQSELADYRLRVYKNELLRQIYEVIRVSDEAYPAYFKLFEDDGFWLKDFLSPPDVSLALALGSDVLCGATLLHYIRGKGLLDRYLI